MSKKHSNSKNKLNKKKRKRKKSDVEFKSAIRIDSKFVEFRKGEKDDEIMKNVGKPTPGYDFFFIYFDAVF